MAEFNEEKDENDHQQASSFLLKVESHHDIGLDDNLNIEREGEGERSCNEEMNAEGSFIEGIEGLEKLENLYNFRDVFGR